MYLHELMRVVRLSVLTGNERSRFPMERKFTPNVYITLQQIIICE